MLQLELGSDKEHAHMCAWCSRMIAPNPNEKSANTQGCGARKRQRAVRSRKAAKSRAKRGGERQTERDNIGGGHISNVHVHKKRARKRALQKGGVASGVQGSAKLTLPT